jgi:nucleotide-binding universal stress UspA family protein
MVTAPAPPHSERSPRYSASLQLEQTLGIVQKQVRHANSLLRQGVAWQEILAQISEAGADLVIIGTHGRRGLSRALLGSVAENVVRMSPVPVLTVRSTES